MRLMSRKRHRQRLRRRRKIRDRVLISSVVKIKGSPCQQDDNYQVDKGISGPDLPEDILRHIHALMPLRDAARAACVSHVFQQSWICRPNLSFSLKTLGLDRNASSDVVTRDLISKIDHIMQNRPGIGVKTLKLDLLYCDSVDSCFLGSWFHTAVTPGIEEIYLLLPEPAYNKPEYNFPCSLLSNGSGNSIRYLTLSGCAFRPTVGIGCLRSLTRLNLFFVRITGDELGCLLSNSSALECLSLRYCYEIICLNVPSMLQRLSLLDVVECTGLQVVESNAPNLSTFYFNGSLGQISRGGSLQVKTLKVSSSHANTVGYARSNLLSIVPNVETLIISSPIEKVNTPMLPGKFLHLKLLHLYVGIASSPAYDYFSLVSFLDASPFLETFMLTIMRYPRQHVLILEEPPHNLRQMPEHHHDKLKSVEISGFCSAKSLVELTCHILENTTSLNCLTLDPTYSARYSVMKFGNCQPLGKDILMEAQKALLAIRRYIVRKVPSTVKFNVLQPVPYYY